MEVIKKYHNQLEKKLNDNNYYYYDNNNCKSKEDCPLGGICNLKKIVYQATIFLKESMKDKKSLYWNFIDQMEVRI